MDLLVMIGLSVFGTVFLFLPSFFAVGLVRQITILQFSSLLRRKYPQIWRELQEPNKGDITGFSRVINLRNYIRTINSSDSHEIIAFKKRLNNFPKGYWRYFIIFGLVIDTLLIVLFLLKN